MILARVARRWLAPFRYLLVFGTSLPPAFDISPSATALGSPVMSLALDSLEWFRWLSARAFAFDELPPPVERERSTSADPTQRAFPSTDAFARRTAVDSMVAAPPRALDP